jgi:hypothetical protein
MDTLKTNKMAQEIDFQPDPKEDIGIVIVLIALLFLSLIAC